MTNKFLPPKYLNIFLVLAIVLHFIFPIKIIIKSPISYIGLGIIVVSLGINLWAVRTLNKEKTAVDFHEAPKKLVKSGPFRVSRNPIYLSGVILLLGLAWLLGSIIGFVFPPALFLIMNKYYIPDEEQRLAAIFGEEYFNYQQKVRRWI